MEKVNLYSEEILKSPKTLLKHTQTNWDEHFMKIAKVVSEMSKDPSTKVGAVIVKDKVIFGTGYNGFPSIIPDYKENYENREIKYKYIIHAEDNSIRNSLKSYGNVPEESTIYVYPFMPCRKCFKLLVQKNFKRIVTYRTDKNSRWKQDWDRVRVLCEEFEIELVELVKSEL